METNINAILQCRAIPVLLLHGKAYNDNHPPNTLACHFNERNLHLPKFNCPNNGENIVHELRKETKSDYFSCLDGKYILCLTSFQESTSDQEHDNLMKSILRANDEEESVVAIPLTVRILQDAIKWLKGTSTIPLENVGTDTLESSVTTSVTTYLASLYDVFPAGTDVSKLRKFIDDHVWPVGSLAELEEELEKKESDEGKYYLLRGFIHRNLARMTKVVAHFVDGNHRAAALNCAWIGYGDDDLDGKNKYYRVCPHADKEVQTTILIPPKLTNKFHTKMRSLSFKSQQSVEKISKHGRREFFQSLMDSLGKILGQDCYLYRGEEQGKKTDDDINEHISNVAQGIQSLFENNSEEMSNWDSQDKFARLRDHADWSILFKKKKKKTEKDNGKYYESFSYHCDIAENIIPTIIRRLGNIESEKRYQRKPFTAHEFELVQLLLWSRLSKTTHTQL